MLVQLRATFKQIVFQREAVRLRPRSANLPAGADRARAARRHQEAAAAEGRHLHPAQQHRQQHRRGQLQVGHMPHASSQCASSVMCQMLLLTVLLQYRAT